MDQWQNVIDSIRDCDTANPTRLKQLHDELSRQGSWLQGQIKSFYSSLGQAANKAPREADHKLSPVLLALGPLDPKLHTLGTVHLLFAQAETQRTVDRAAFLRVACSLLCDCDPVQVHFAPRHFLAICARFGEEHARQNTPMAAVLPLIIAGTRCAPTESCIHPAHGEALHACLLAKRYDVAVRLLDDRPTHEVDPRRTALTPPLLLRYLYLAGVAYVGLKRWREAMDAFRSCMSVPATAPSAIAVEAYKKLVLCALIADGAAPTMPRHVPSALSRQLRGAALYCNVLVDRFKEGSVAGLGAVLRDNADAIARDGNMGLAKQVVAALTKWKISRLTHTYITLSLQDIATQAGLSGPQEAEQHILAMVTQGDICARIEQPSGTVTFTEEDEGEFTAGMLKQMEAEMEEAMRLADKVRKVDAELSANSKYLGKMSRRQLPERGGPSGVLGPAVHIAAGPTGVDMDEEMALSLMSEENGSFDLR